MTTRCKDPPRVAQVEVPQPRLSCIEEPGVVDFTSFDLEFFWYHAIQLKNAVYYAALFFILSESLVTIKYIIHCRYKDALAAFVAIFICWFVILTMITPDCGFNQDLGYKFANAFEFSCSVLLIGVAIYSTLVLAEYISNCWLQSLWTFIVAVIVIYILIMCFGDPEGKDRTEWEKTGSPVPLFKDLK